MKRRDLIVMVGGAAVMVWPAERAADLPHIGYLGFEPAAGGHPELGAFLAGPADLGYVDGRTIAIDYRMANRHSELLFHNAQDLVTNRVAVIVAFDPTLSAVAKAMHLVLNRKATAIGISIPPTLRIRADEVIE